MLFLIKKYLARILAIGALAFFASPAHAAETFTYYHLDALGSPVAATDQQGNVVWRKEYTPHGEEILNQTQASTDTLGFTGHPFDAPTGLTYMGAR